VTLDEHTETVFFRSDLNAHIFLCTVKHLETLHSIWVASEKQITFGLCKETLANYYGRSTAGLQSLICSNMQKQTKMSLRALQAFPRIKSNLTDKRFGDEEMLKLHVTQQLPLPGV
jgi:hypothetical protein